MASRLQALRTSRNITQERLAMLTGIHRVTIARYEGERVKPSLENAAKIANALGVSIEELMYSDGLSDHPAGG